MKPQIKTLISISTIIIIALLLINYIKSNISDFKQLSIANPIYLIPLIIIFLISLFANGFLLKTLMKPFKIKLKNLEAFGLSVVTNFYNLITPFRGGAGVRAMYLKKKHEFPYVHFLATLSAIYVIIFLVGSLGGLLSMIYIWLNYQMFNWLIFSVFLIFFTTLLSIIIFSPKLSESKNKWTNRFVKVINGWHLIKNNKKIIFTTSIIAFIQLMLGSLNFLIAYSIFGIEINFFKALFIASIGSLAMLLAITPGNLGIGDAINVFSANVMGIGLTEAIGATLLLRAVNLLVIFILGPIFSYILLKHKPNKQNETKN